MNQSRILILNFGSQYAELIARRVREIGVYSELKPYSISADEIKAFQPSGIILSGGPESVLQSVTPRVPSIVFELGCPVLGICYGMQAMAMQFGGKVATGTHREFGYAKTKVLKDSPLFADLNLTHGEFEAWMSHGDHVSEAPNDFEVIATSQNESITAIAHADKHFYGLQFHPEVSHTRQGLHLLQNFVLNICQCPADWTAHNYLEKMRDEIKAKVGDEEVILGLSGGVDSSVVAALLHEIIPDQLHCVFVDSGLLRQDECAEVQRVFADHYKIKLTTVDAQAQFFSALKGVSDPEQKRKIIGEVFVNVFDEVAKQNHQVKWLAQGTIYPDVIESAVDKLSGAHVIKTHHNVGGLPAKMNLKVLEPLRTLFKDEVRKLGLELGLPASLIHRHPFPGPGLGVRVLGEIKKPYVDILRAADAILIHELKAKNLYDTVAQAFVVFLPVKSVAVLGDARSYEYVLAIRVVDTQDFMTAEWSRLPFEFLAHVAGRIINEVRGVSRVTYDISSKPPATIEWE